MNSNRVVTGLFEGYKFYHTGKSIELEKDHSTFQDHLQDKEIPLSLLRYNYGKTYGMKIILIFKKRITSHVRGRIN
jgi:hypothetical protein